MFFYVSDVLSMINTHMMLLFLRSTRPQCICFLSLCANWLEYIWSCRRRRIMHTYIRTHINLIRGRKEKETRGTHFFGLYSTRNMRVWPSEFISFSFVVVVQPLSKVNVLRFFFLISSSSFFPSRERLLSMTHDDKQLVFRHDADARCCCYFMTNSLF